MNKKIYTIALGIIFATILSASAAEPQMSKAGIVIKLQLGNESAMLLSIALSFTSPREKPMSQGVRIVKGDLPSGGEKTIFGFRNGDGVGQIKLPIFVIDEVVSVNEEKICYES